jgi:hypothetical protein
MIVVVVEVLNCDVGAAKKKSALRVREEREHLIGRALCART